MSEITAQYLLRTSTVTVSDVCCQGTCRRPSAEEYVAATQLVFPHRGVYVRHLGLDETVAEANQVLFFNAPKATGSATPCRAATQVSCYS
jgi:hypothetical protein